MRERERERDPDQMDFGGLWERGFVCASERERELSCERGRVT